MAKNLFKKGLAVIASSALGTAALVVGATPAYAANELKIEPASGSVYAVSSDEAFTLKTSFTPGNSSSGVTSQIKYVVTDTSATPGQKQINFLANATETAVDEHTELTSAAITTSDPDNSAVVAGAASAIGYVGFAVTAASTSSTYSIEVQAFVDTDGDNVIDDGEWTSNKETITFLKHSAIGFDVNMSGVSRQSAAVQVRITSTVVNIEQMYNDADSDGSRFIVDLYDGTNFGTQVDGTDVLADYDATDKRLEADFTPTALDAAEALRARVYLSDAAVDGVTNVAAANKSTTSALATRIQQVGAAVVQAGMADVAVVDNMDVSDATSAANNASFASGSGTFTVRTQVTYATGYGAGDANVYWTLTEQAVNSIQADGSITAGGETLLNKQAGAEEKINFFQTTDAKGYSTVTVSYSGLDAGDKFQMSATIEGETATELTLTAVDRDLTKVENTNAIGTNDDSAQLVFPVGQDVVLTYAAVDQFGKAWTKAGGSVTVTFGGKAGTGAITNGTATVTLAAFDADEATTGTTSTTTNYNGSGAGIAEPNVAVKIGTQATPAAVTALGADHTASNNAGALNLEAGANADTRSGDLAPAFTSGSSVQLDGVVTDADLNQIPADVTVSAPGLMFEKDGVWSMDSITVRSNSSGQYFVDVYSNLAGAQTITVTSGSASKTEVLYFEAAGDDTGTSLTIDAPSYVQSGSTLQIKGSLTDKFGNAVEAGGTNTSAAGADFKIVYTGPGLLVGTTPTSTNSDGEANLNYLLGQNDTGSISVTYYYDRNGDADYTDATDLVVTKTITIGSAPTSYGDVSAWTVDQGDGTAKVYVKFPTIGEKVRIGHQTGGSGSYETIYVKTTTSETMDGLNIVEGVGTYIVRTIDLASGTNRIRVDVGDDRLVQVRYND